jgi:hypothetical protein
MNTSMTPDKLNTIAFRIVCIIICAFLIIGGVGACINHQYMKGGVGFLVTPIIIFIGLKPASIKTWGLMIAVFAVTMYFVGAIGN